MKTAGVVFDFYDDPTGALVKSAFPTAESLPDIVKEAHILSPEDHSVLRDDAYALIMHNEGKILRKFACVDEGNTLLSCLYFEQVADKLPEEARKTAAVNLAHFCEEFGFEPSNAVKLAAREEKPSETKGVSESSMGRSRDPMRQPLLGDEADWAARTNLTSIRGGSDQGRVVPTANQMKTAGMMMPGMPSGGPKPMPNTSVGVAGAGGTMKTPAVPSVAGKSVTAGAKQNLSNTVETIYGTLLHPVEGAAKGAIFGGLSGAGLGAIKELKADPKTGNTPSRAELIRDHARRGAMAGAIGGGLHGAATSGILHLRDAASAEMDAERRSKWKEGSKKVNYLDGFHKLNPEANPHKGAGTNEKRHITGKDKNPEQQHHKAPTDKNAFSTATGHGDLEVNAKQTMWPKISSIVDVSGKQAEAVVLKKTASRYALGDRYPLDSYSDVQAAVAYFDQNWTEMDPESRHEFSVKTASRADELGISVSERMERYGSTEYAPDVEAHIASRKANSDSKYHEMYDALLEKRSSIEPEVFAQLLSKADEVANLSWFWGGDISDPFLATFGPTEKLAESLWSWQSRVGDMVNAEQLNKLARNGKGVLKKHFSQDLVEGFIKDPIAVFDSLPDDTKTVIARLAAGEFDSLPMN